MQKISIQLKVEPFNKSYDLFCKKTNVGPFSLFNIAPSRRTALELARRGAASIMLVSEPNNLGSDLKTRFGTMKKVGVLVSE